MRMKIRGNSVVFFNIYLCDHCSRSDGSLCRVLFAGERLRQATTVIRESGNLRTFNIIVIPLTL